MFSLAWPRGHLLALNFLHIYLLSLSHTIFEICAEETLHPKIRGKESAYNQCNARNLVKVFDKAL